VKELDQVHRDRLLVWVEALESGRYRQGTGQLRVANTFGETLRMCCLGVACEVSGLGRWEPDTDNYVVDGAPRDELNGDLADHGGRYVAGTYLPLAVAEHYGVDDYNPEFVDRYGAPRWATDLNDVDGATFAEIAAAIRRTYDLPARDEVPTS